MPSKKDPNAVAVTGTGLSGTNSVSAGALTFLVADLNPSDVTQSDLGVFDTITVSVAIQAGGATATVGSLTANTGITTGSLTATGTVTSTGGLRTTSIEPNTGNSISLGDNNLLDVNGFSVDTISANSGATVTVSSTLDVSAGGGVKTDTLTSHTAAGNISLGSDLVGTGDLAGYSFSKTLQRFKTLEEAYDTIAVGDTALVESYDPTKFFGQRLWETNVADEFIVASATDGRYLYVMYDNGVNEVQALKVDSEDGSALLNYTLSFSTLVGQEYFVETNGENVAFGVNDGGGGNSVIDLFQVDNATALQTYVPYPSLANSNTFRDMYMNHEAIVAVTSDGTFVLIDLGNLNISYQQYFGVTNYLGVCGYGTYFILYTINTLLLFDYASSTYPAPIDVYERPLDSFAGDAVFNRIETDGHFIYMIAPFDNPFPGAFRPGGLKVYPFDPQGFFNMTRIFSAQFGDLYDRITWDHRYLYVGNANSQGLGDYQLRVYDKGSFQLRRQLDLRQVLPSVGDPTVDSRGFDLHSNGESLFVSANGDTGTDWNLFKVYVEQEPSLFVKLDPEGPKERIFHHVMHPVSVGGTTNSPLQLQTGQVVARTWISLSIDGGSNVTVNEDTSGFGRRFNIANVTFTEPGGADPCYLEVTFDRPLDPAVTQYLVSEYPIALNVTGGWPIRGVVHLLSDNDRIQIYFQRIDDGTVLTTSTPTLINLPIVLTAIGQFA